MQPPEAGLLLLAWLLLVIATLGIVRIAPAPDVPMALFLALS
jgi:hypothetical protein